jgi:hypothetical protein
VTADLESELLGILDANLYLVLGTTEPDGTARVSPVWFTHVQGRHLYWVSSPVARHSLNIGRVPAVSCVVFDSTRPPGQGAAAYLTCTAGQVDDDHLAAESQVAFATAASRGARSFEAHELSGEGSMRLYHAAVRRQELHLRGSDPRNEGGVDTRLLVADIDPE